MLSAADRSVVSSGDEMKLALTSAATGVNETGSTVPSGDDTESASSAARSESGEPPTGVTEFATPFAAGPDGEVALLIATSADEDDGPVLDVTEVTVTGAAPDGRTDGCRLLEAVDPVPISELTTFPETVRKSPLPRSSRATDRELKSCCSWSVRAIALGATSFGSPFEGATKGEAIGRAKP
jgi:hypothetical protein